MRRPWFLPRPFLMDHSWIHHTPLAAPTVPMLTWKHLHLPMTLSAANRSWNIVFWQHNAFGLFISDLFCFYWPNLFLFNMQEPWNRNGARVTDFIFGLNLLGENWIICLTCERRKMGGKKTCEMLVFLFFLTPLDLFCTANLISFLLELVKHSVSYCCKWRHVTRVTANLWAAMLRGV